MEQLKPFSGCVLWLCPLGSTMSHVRRCIFSARVSELGGEIAESPNENVTHIVVGSSVTTGSFWKLGYAVPKCTEVVTDDWLVESLRLCKKVNTDAYQHSKGMQRAMNSVEEKEATHFCLGFLCIFAWYFVYFLYIFTFLHIP